MRAFLVFIILGALSFSAKGAVPDALIYSKSACYGPCPIYQVIVFSDGTVIFNGMKYVKSEGFYKLERSPDLFQQILLITSKYNIKGFKDNYSYSDETSCKAMWTDHPTTTIRLQLDGRVKTIEHYLGCKGFEHEAELIAMESELDKTLGLRAYIGK